MERITGGDPAKKRYVEKDFIKYPDFSPDNLPCLCDLPKVTIMKRGAGTHAIYWADCRNCGRQWQAALNLEVAINYYVFAMASKEDPMALKVRKKRKPKVKLEEPKKKEKKPERFKTVEAAKEVLRRHTMKEKQLRKQLEELKKKRNKK